MQKGHKCLKAYHSDPHLLQNPTSTVPIFFFNKKETIWFSPNCAPKFKYIRVWETSSLRASYPNMLFIPSYKQPVADEYLKLACIDSVTQYLASTRPVKIPVKTKQNKTKQSKLSRKLLKCKELVCGSQMSTLHKTAYPFPEHIHLLIRLSSVL